MHDPDPIATRKSWKVAELPTARALLPLEGSFSMAEFEKLRRGFIPREMEDHWFIFFEEPWLYFHRSWTGHAIYGLRFVKNGEGYRLEEAWASRDPQQYRSDSVQNDVANLWELLHHHLNAGGS